MQIENDPSVPADIDIWFGLCRFIIVIIIILKYNGSDLITFFFTATYNIDFITVNPYNAHSHIIRTYMPPHVYIYHMLYIEQPLD